MTTPIDDLEERIKLLRAASRPGEPLSDRDGPTAQGHILSALSKLERSRALALAPSVGKNPR